MNNEILKVVLKEFVVSTNDRVLGIVMILALVFLGLGFIFLNLWFKHKKNTVKR